MMSLRAAETDSRLSFSNSQNLLTQPSCTCFSRHLLRLMCVHCDEQLPRCVSVTSSVAFPSAAPECKWAQRRRCCPWLQQKRAPPHLLAVATACRVRRPPNQHAHLEEQNTSADWLAQRTTVQAKVSCMHSHMYSLVHVLLLLFTLCTCRGLQDIAYKWVQARRTLGEPSLPDLPPE